MKASKKSLFITLFAALAAALSLLFYGCGNAESGSAQKYTLTFMNGTEVYATIVEEAGKPIAPPDAPQKDGVEFDGWSITENGVVGLFPQTMPSRDATYYAVFSARYTLTLKADVGSIEGESTKQLSVKSGSKLYDLVSEYAPVGPDDSTFYAWYYGSKKLDADSTIVMPAEAASVTAKYTVEFTVKSHKQSSYGVDDYALAETVVKTDIVGDIASSIPAYPGYKLNAEKDNAVTVLDLSSKKSQNVFDAYYDLEGYTVSFDANMREDVRVSGKMEDLTLGYKQEYTAPKCEYTATGYRFRGWAKQVGSDIDFRAGGPYSIEKDTVLYAIWAEAYTEVTGLSSDYIYIAEDEDNNPAAFLDRLGLGEKQGSYDPNTGEFIFRDDNDRVMLRGMINQFAHTYMRVDSTISEYAKYDFSQGDIVEGESFTINADGSAVYQKGEESVRGIYSFDFISDSMLFTAGETQFAFRLDTAEIDGETVPVFLIRGEEYGSWYQYSASGSVSAYHYLTFDGYGRVTVTNSGYNTSLEPDSTSYSGLYTVEESADENHFAIDAVVVGYNAVRRKSFMLMKGSYANSNGTTYERVYIEKGYSGTIYRRPEEGNSIDTSAAADSIELDGYGVFDDSVTYKYTEAGVQKTVTGKYVLNSYIDLLTITDADGVQYKLGLDINGYTEDEQTYSVFDDAIEATGEYIVLGLEGSAYIYYTLRLFNDGTAAMAFYVPEWDTFYQIASYDYFPLISGTYSHIEGSENPDAYEFVSTRDPEMIDKLNRTFSVTLNIKFDVTYFYRYKFEFVRNTETNAISYCRATAKCDSAIGSTITLEGETYTLDGYGNAVGAENTYKYSYFTSYNIDYISLSIAAAEGEGPMTDYVYMRADGAMRRLVDNKVYTSYNMSYSIGMYILEDDYAVLAYKRAESGTIFESTYFYAEGTLTWTSAEKRFAKYTQLNKLLDNDYGNRYTELYSLFRFGFLTKSSVDYFYLYEVGATVDEDGVSTITTANGSVLAINTKDVTATLTVPDASAAGGSKVYSGRYFITSDIIRILYEVDEIKNDYIAATLVFSGDEITSFKVVSREVGTWWEIYYKESYLMLSGEQVEGGYSAKYYVYSEELDDFVEYSGVYERTDDTSMYEYSFTYVTGQDGEGNDITETFKFQTGVSTQTSLPVFAMYSMPVSIYVYDRINGAPIGTMVGGGYNRMVFTHGRYSYYGKFVVFTDNVFEFKSDDGEHDAFFVLVSIGDGALYMLDRTYLEDNMGKYDCPDGSYTVRMPAKDNEEDELTMRDVTFIQVRLSGYGVAQLVTEINESEGTYNYISCYYVIYTSYTLILYTYDANGDVYIITLFQIRIDTDDSTGEEITTYHIILSDTDFVGGGFMYSFIKSDWSTFVADGFNNAAYTTSDGIRYDCVYTRLESHPNIIKVRYYDNQIFRYVEFYIEVDLTAKTFVILEDSDPRLPAQEP